MPKILVIDDDHAMSRALAVRLRNAGFQVVSVDQPTDGAISAIRERPDVILLDADMRRFSGPDLHDCLRFADRARHIPVVYLSSRDSESVRRSAFEQGAKAFITKPFDSQHLLATLARITGTPWNPPVTWRYGLREVG